MRGTEGRHEGYREGGGREAWGRPEGSLKGDRRETEGIRKGSMRETNGDKGRQGGHGR